MRRVSLHKETNDGPFLRHSLAYLSGEIDDNLLG